MKKYSWIVALLLALSLVIMGCPNDGGKEPEPTPPKEDLVITGSDIVLEVAGTAAPVTIEGNKVTITGTDVTGSGFYYAVPENAKDYNEFEVEFTVVEVKTGAFRLMLKSSTSFDNPSNVTDANHLNEFGMDDDKGIGKGVAGATGTTGKWKLSLMQSKKNITFQHQAWIAGGSKVNGDVDYTFEVSKITFFGSGEGEPEPEPLPSFVVENPKATTTSANITIETDYTAAFTGNGVVNWAFDFEDEDGNGVDAYDFVTITYSAETANNAGFKIFNTQNDINGEFKSVATGADLELKLELRYTRNGVSVQKWSGTEMTVKITKLVFEKGERLPVTFRLGTYTGTDTAPVFPSYFVKGTKVGPLPEAPFWAGKLFTGWYKGTTAITKDTEVDASFDRATLTAGWTDEPTVADFTVAFTAGDDAPFAGSVHSAGTVTSITATSYTFTQTAGYGPYAMFKITLPTADRLAYFDKITFDYTAVSGDIGNKTLRLVASPTATATAAQGDLNGGAMSYGVSANLNPGAGNTSTGVTITIDKGKAFSNLTSNEVWIGFYMHAADVASGTTTPNTSYTIANLVLSQNP